MSDPHTAEVFDRRTHTTRGLVVAVNDEGCVQTMDVKTHDGVVRQGAEVHQFWGFSANPPANGAVVVMIANGGDPSDMIALPAAVAFARLGGLQPGETAIYGVDGTRVHIKIGGIVEILAATQVLVNAPAVNITAPGDGCSINGTFTVAGDTTITGSVTINGDAHITGNLQVDGNINADGTDTGDTP